jgi:hypothetical protein
VLPNVDWSDPSWGAYQRDKLSIEFCIGDEHIVDDVVHHVRGSGDPFPANMSVAKLKRCRVSTHDGRFPRP